MLVNVFLSCLPPVVQYALVLKFGYDDFFCYLSLRPHVLEGSARATTSLADAAIVCLSTYLSIQLGI
jgi:hypothetical protein